MLLDEVDSGGCAKFDPLRPSRFGFAEGPVCELLSAKKIVSLVLEELLAVRCLHSGGNHPAKIMPAPSTARMAPSQAGSGGRSPLINHIIGSITTGAIELKTATTPASYLRNA
jgi:hypothetical protein